MQRIKYDSQLNLIKSAINILPVKAKNMIESVDFIIDYKPFLAGYELIDETNDGRKWIDICYYSPSLLNPDKRRMIYINSEYAKLFNPLDPIFHELGHAIHEKLGDINYKWIPISDYEKCYYESFACSFTRWLYKDRQLDSWGNNQETQRKFDIRPIEFFNELFT